MAKLPELLCARTPRQQQSRRPITPWRSPFTAALVAAATANRRLDAHWHLQDDLLTMPGIKLDLVGKLESFGQDFASVLNHAGASARLRQIADVHFNASQHKPWPNYYTADLADRVYRAYERDFDRFNYPA